MTERKLIILLQAKPFIYHFKISNIKTFRENIHLIINITLYYPSGLAFLDTMWNTAFSKTINNDLLAQVDES